MKKNILTTIFVLLISGLTLWYTAFHKQEISLNFIPGDVLYHGSTNTNITVFEPRSNSVRGKKEGPVVFATPSLKLASCYLFHWDDSWVEQSISLKNGNVFNYQITMVISDKTRFKKEDHGGSIYILPPEGFTFNKHTGLKIYEWIHNSSVTPILKMDFSSALLAMEKMGVKVYFIEQEQFQYYLSLPEDLQKEFLLKLKNK